MSRIPIPDGLAARIRAKAERVEPLGLRSTSAVLERLGLAYVASEHSVTRYPLKQFDKAVAALAKKRVDVGQRPRGPNKAKKPAQDAPDVK